ncbi:MAG TPA: AAA family ATPase [Ktedonobacteraceae bacterium]|nr:AAA family ATPase [Ktedonobacteraceae bacterium]
MKLESLTVNNFRQYFGMQRLDFARDKKKMVTIINGVNGAGKTSLFLAINWCLYGEGVDNIGELISKEAIRNAQPGDVVTTYVTLSFSHDGENYLVKRTRQGRRLLDDEGIQIITPDEFTMMRLSWDDKPKQIQNPIGTMNAILPSNVRSYFLFDGEKIDDFAKPEASKEVKKAIYLVFKLEILERARRHLEGTAADYRTDLRSKASGELRELVDEDDKARSDIAKKEQQLEELEEEISSAKRQIEDIDQRLREIQDVKLLQQSRDHIEEDLKASKADLDGLQKEIREIASSSYLRVAYPTIKRVHHILDEKRSRGEIPSNIRQTLVEDLIKQGRCICGRAFSEDGPEHQLLMSLLHNSFPGSLEDDVLAISADMRSFEGYMKRQVSDLDQYMRRKTELVDKINDLDAADDDLGRKLKGSPLKEVSDLEQQRRNYQEAINGHFLAIGEIKGQLKILGEKTADLEKRIAKAQSNEAKVKLLRTKLELAQNAADAIKATYHSYAQEVREKIEGQTKEIFKTLVWKDSHFQDIRLSQDFELEVIDRYQKPSRSEMSAGERQVLSLSFITAMSRISEEEAPLVMDTPFGRLSSTPRDNVTKYLPDLVDQIILFVTDEELHGQARANLEPRIGSEYRLDFNSDSSSTKIVEINNYE